METHNSNQSNTSSAAVAAAKSEDLPLTGNQVAALSYFFPPFAIAALLLKQYEKDEKVRFSAIQSLVFCGASILASFALSLMVSIFLGVIGAVAGMFEAWRVTLFFAKVTGAVSMGVSLAMLGAWLALIISSAQGKVFKLPMLGGIAERFAKKLD